MSRDPIALADSDLAVDGVSTGLDTAEVLRKLGRPRSRAREHWTYEGLSVYFEGGRMTEVHLTTAKRVTARGIRVDDTVELLELRYGESCQKGAYAYCRSLEDANERGILFIVQNGRVVEIDIGKIFDLD